jgi:hypothetical protein
LQNKTTVRLGFLLHLPSTNLARQVEFSAGDQRESEHDIKLKALEPMEGEFFLRMCVWVRMGLQGSGA